MVTGFNGVVILVDIENRNAKEIIILRDYLGEFSALVGLETYDYSIYIATNNLEEAKYYKPGDDKIYRLIPKE